jgi:protein SCO1/2
MIARRLVAWIISAVILSFAGNSFAWSQTPPSMTPSPRLPSVEFRDHDGRAVRLDRAIGDRVVILNFFFAGCVTICPPQTAILQQVHDIFLGGDRDATAPMIVSISIDPSEPSQIRAYAKQFGIRLGASEGWLMLTGSFDTLIRTAAAFDDAGSRPQDHSGTIWIGNPQIGRWFRIPFSSPEATSPQALAALAKEAAR